MKKERVISAPASSCFNLVDHNDETEGRTKVYSTMKVKIIVKGLPLLRKFLHKERAL